MILKKIFFPRAYQYVKAAHPIHGDVHLVERAGGRIKSVLYRSREAGQLVILCHPYLREAKDYFLTSGHIELYLELGCDVVIFDFNGFGESDDIDLKLHKDIYAVVSYYIDLNRYNSIHAHGLSMGSSMVINAIQESCDIDKVIIENCLDTNFSYFKKRNKALYVLLNIVDYVFPAINKRNAYYKEVSTIHNAIREVMYLYCDKDDLTTAEMGKVLFDNTQVSSSFHILNGEHLTAIETDPIKYKSLIGSFIKE